jgi:hypothetical protein
MRHIQIFENYSDSDFEIPSSFQLGDGFDPVKAKKAVEEASEERGGKSKEDRGLNFPNIKEVYGTDSYNTRFYIAQALHILGYSLFPYNSHFPLEKAKPGDIAKMTYYIGEPWQNEIMKNISPKLLRAIAPWVEKIMLYPDKFLRTNVDLQRTTKSPGVARESRMILPMVSKLVADSSLEKIDGKGIPTYLNVYRKLS